MPTLFSHPNSVPVGSQEIVPINVGFAPYMQPGDALSNPVSLLTQDGTGATITPMDAPTVLRSAVVASPAPTLTSFTVGAGLGVLFLAFAQAPLGAGMVLTIGGQVGTVQTITGDLVALASPLSTVPLSGDAVTSTFVQQRIRGSQLTPKHSYRLDITAVLNSSKTMTVSTAIPCAY